MMIKSKVNSFATDQSGGNQYCDTVFRQMDIVLDVNGHHDFV